MDVTLFENLPLSVLGNMSKAISAKVPYTQSANLADRLTNVVAEENIYYGLIEGAGHMDSAFYTDSNPDNLFAFLAD